MSNVHIFKELHCTAPNPNATGDGDTILYQVTTWLDTHWDELCASGLSSAVVKMAGGCMTHDMLKAGAQLSELRWEMLDTLPIDLDEYKDEDDD